MRGSQRRSRAARLPEDRVERRDLGPSETPVAAAHVVDAVPEALQAVAGTAGDRSDELDRSDPAAEV